MVITNQPKGNRKHRQKYPNLHHPPRYILRSLRSHFSGVTTLFILLDNEKFYSEDGSGLVASTSTCTLRPISFWKAHNGGLQEWGEHIITYVAFSFFGSTTYTKGCREVRENKLHVWLHVEELPGIGRSADLNRPPILDGRECLDLLRVSVDVLAAERQRNSLSSKDQSSEAPEFS